MPKNKKMKMKKKKQNNNHERKPFNGKCFNCMRKGCIIHEYRKNNMKKPIKLWMKQMISSFVLSLMKEQKKMCIGIKTLHTDLLPSNQVAGIICTIILEIFYMFMKNTWIGNSGALCHITNDDTCLYNIIKHNELVQERSVKTDGCE